MNQKKEQADTYDDSIKDSEHMGRMQTLGEDIRDLESRRSGKIPNEHPVQGRHSGNRIFENPGIHNMFKKSKQDEGERAKQLNQRIKKMSGYAGSGRQHPTQIEEGMTPDPADLRAYDSHLGMQTRRKSKFSDTHNEPQNLQQFDHFEQTPIALKTSTNKHRPTDIINQQQKLLKPKPDNEEPLHNISNLIYSQDGSSLARPHQPTHNPRSSRQANAPANSPAPIRLLHSKELEAKGFTRVGSPTMRSQNSERVNKAQDVQGGNHIRRLSRNFEGTRQSNVVSWAQLNQKRHFKTMPAEKSFSQRGGVGEGVKQDVDTLSQIEYMMWDNGRSNSQIWHKKREYKYEFNDHTYGKQQGEGSPSPTQPPVPPPPLKKKKLKLKKKPLKKKKRKSKTPKKTKKSKKKKPKKSSTQKPKKKRVIIRRKRTVTKYVKGKNGKRQRKSVVTTTTVKVPKRKSAKGKGKAKDEYITTVEKSEVVGGSIRNSVIKTSSIYHPSDSAQGSLVADSGAWNQGQFQLKAIRSIQKIRGDKSAGPNKLTRSSIQFKTMGAAVGQNSILLYLSIIIKSHIYKYKIHYTLSYSRS